MSANPFGRVLAVCALLGPALGYVQFREQIPNALNIEETLGAGHVSRGGGGEVNAFGSAFRDADFLWTLDLCAADSDGDGESNGLELGDPCCVWLPGATPARNWGVSHPGEKRSASGARSRGTRPPGALAPLPRAAHAAARPAVRRREDAAVLGDGAGAHGGGRERGVLGVLLRQPFC